MAVRAPAPTLNQMAEQGNPPKQILATREHKRTGLLLVGQAVGSPGGLLAFQTSPGCAITVKLDSGLVWLAKRPL